LSGYVVYLVNVRKYRSQRIKYKNLPKIGKKPLYTKIKQIKLQCHSGKKQNTNELITSFSHIVTNKISK